MCFFSLLFQSHMKRNSKQHNPGSFSQASYETEKKLHSSEPVLCSTSAPILFHGFPCVINCSSSDDTISEDKKPPCCVDCMCKDKDRHETQLQNKNRYQFGVIYFFTAVVAF